MAILRKFSLKNWFLKIPTKHGEREIKLGSYFFQAVKFLYESKDEDWKMGHPLLEKPFKGTSLKESLQTFLLWL